MGRKWRGHRFALLIVILGLIAAAPAVLSAAKITDPWVLSGSAVLAGLVAVSGVSLQEYYRQPAHRRDEKTVKGEDGCLVLADGRLPAVRNITNPLLLGVHKAAAAAVRDTHAEAYVPAYVTRDIDPDLRGQLAVSGFVLLVGDSAAGKTRTAFEAMAAVLAGHVLICPVSRNAVPVAVARAAQIRRCVLWLDDLENYLGSGGLTTAHLGRLLTGDGHHRVIISTLRAAEEARILADGSPADDGDREALRDARQIFDQAHHIRVQRMFTRPELARARALDSDPRVAEALRRAGRYGVTEYLAAGPELLRDWEDARSSSEGTHARGAALVAAAIDIRRSGFTSPIPQVLLEQVHERYLEDPGHALIPREPTSDAWAWATRPRRATTAFLSPAGPGQFEVFDYLVDLLQRRIPHGGDIPDTVVRAVIDHAEPADADAVGAAAYTQSRYGLAADGWRHAWETKAAKAGLGADHPDTVASRNSLALLLLEMGRLKEAEDELRAILSILVRRLGENHPDALTARLNLALALRGLWRLTEAETELRFVMEIRSREFGAEDPDTLAVRVNIALVQGDHGHLAEAEAEHRAVAHSRARVLGPEHPHTLTSRNLVATLCRQRGRTAEAEAEHRAVLAICDQTLGPEHPATLRTRNNIALVLRSLGRLEEAEAEHRAVLEICDRTLGPEHPSTLTTRSNLAYELREKGFLEEAEAEQRSIVHIRARVLGAEHPNTLTSRSDLAHVLRDRGLLAAAEAEHRAVLEICDRTLGPEHPSTLTTRSNLAHVLREKGHLEEAEAEHTAALKSCIRVLGRTHPGTLATRLRLAMVLHDQGNPAEAEAERRAVVTISERDLPAAIPAIPPAANDAETLLGWLGRLAEAAAEHRAVADISVRSRGREDPSALASSNNLHSVLRGLGPPTEAGARHGSS